MAKSRIRLLIFVFAAALAFASVIFLAACTKGAGYTDRSVRVFSYGEEKGELSLRFYNNSARKPHPTSVG